MSLLRSINGLRNVVNRVQKGGLGPTVSSVRNSGGLYSYRVGGYPPTRFQVVGGNALSATMWWWILWHLWHEPDHILGEFDFPDPKKWTNDELGIPPDDE